MAAARMGAERRATAAEQDAVIMNCRRDESNKRASFEPSSYFAFVSLLRVVGRPSSRYGRDEYTRRLNRTTKTRSCSAPQARDTSDSPFGSRLVFNLF